MNFLKFFTVFLVVLSVNVFAEGKCKKTECHALLGTNTIVISISIDENGYPQPSLMDEMNLHPGQKIVFAGPDEFTIFFKDGKSPFKKSEFQSKDGVVILRIPEHIFEDSRFSEDIYRNSAIDFTYGIVVNGRVTDPTIRITKTGE